MVMNCPFAHFDVGSGKEEIKGSSGEAIGSFVPENERYPVELIIPEGTLGKRNELEETVIEFFGYMKDMTTLIPYMNRAILCTNYPPGNIRYLRASRKSQSQITKYEKV
ncbi:hypothetical protein HDU67_007506 [Dinochytrium kinnereticum]|nr:hypothetical protein HDU67_007506 [Dinochytrium kinnereticum]